MCRVIDANHAFACGHIERCWPGVTVMRPQGTYMLFLDCGAWCDENATAFPALLRRGVEAGVIWQNGEDFLAPRSIRLNLALPTEKLKEAFARLDTIFIK